MRRTPVTNKQKLFVGIDPGKKGAFVGLNEDNTIHIIHDWPKSNSFVDVCDVLRQTFQTRNVCAVLERVHAMPKQGVSSMFTFGRNFGAWEMLLCAFKAQHVIVPPQTWMKGLVSKNDGDTTKTSVANICKRMFPDAKITGPQGGLKDGRADALLMAVYAKRYFQ